jgi:ankyrin repeat protein
LLEEALRGNPQAVRAYLDAGGSPVASAHLRLGDITLEKQLPLLHGMAFTSWHPHQELAKSVKLLSEAGADNNAPFPEDGNTALLRVLARRCCSALPDVLLQAGADPYVRSSSPRRITAMHEAAVVGSADTCKLLLERAALLLDAKDAEGWTPLMYAVYHGRLDMVELLLQHGADIEAVENSNSTALIVASFAKQASVALYLLQAGANMTAVDCDGHTALTAAVQAGSLASVQLLLDHGADIKEIDKEGQNALFTAALEGHVFMLEVLTQHGLDATSVDNKGMTLLMAAAASEHQAAAEWLILRGVGVNRVNIDGATALHIAVLECSNDDTTMVELLIASGANVHIRADNGESAYDIAIDYGNVECARVLLAAGSDVGPLGLHIAIKRGCDALVFYYYYLSSLNSLTAQQQS